MGNLDFYVEFNIEVDRVDDDFTREAEDRLRALVGDRKDIVGASVALEKLVRAESPYLFQVRIVVYRRPESMAVIEKGPDPLTTLGNALSALERKVREDREKRSEAHIRKPDQVDTIVEDLNAREVYATYMKGADPSMLVNTDRTEIASRLMVDQGLSQKSAYFAADKILKAAQEMNSQRLTSRRNQSEKHN